MTPLTVADLVVMVPAFTTASYVVGYTASYALYLFRRTVWLTT